MRWIDIELPVTGTDPQHDALLDQAAQLAARLGGLQEREGLDSVRVTAHMAEVGRLLFQAVVAGDPHAFRPDDKRRGARPPQLGRSDSDPLIGYHIVCPPSRLALPWSWLHNSVGFLLERHPLCAAPVGSEIPEAEAPRPWMQRYSEQLFRMRGGAAAGRTDRSQRPAAALPEIFFVPGHCEEKIRRLIHREAEGIGAALAAAPTCSARLHLPNVVVTPQELASRSLHSQALHYAGPTSRPSETGLAADRWLFDLLAGAAPPHTDPIAELTGMELDVVGVDPVDAILDQVSEAYELDTPPLAPVAAPDRATPSRADAPDVPADLERRGTRGRSASARSGRDGHDSPPGETGWLLEDGPVRPEGMARDGLVPPLVFSNSYLSLPILGARFCAAGASAFIGPTAPLYSRPARLYAARFYDFLADGLCAGAALRAAALALREKYGADHPAWLSYGMVGYGVLALRYL